MISSFNTMTNCQLYIHDITAVRTYKFTIVDGEMYILEIPASIRHIGIL